MLGVLGVLSSNDGCVIARSEESIPSWSEGEWYTLLRGEMIAMILPSNCALYGQVSRRVVSFLEG